MERNELKADADDAIRAAAVRIKSELTASGSRPDRPQRVKFFNLPPAMTAAPRWVLWAWAQVNGKWTKRPLQRNGVPASTTDAKTWCAFAEARSAYEHGEYDGIGFVLGDGWAGVDIDKCAARLAPGEPYKFTALAEQVALALSGYAEVSPTGTGLKVFVRANVLDRIRELNKRTGYKRTDLDLELYAADRFFTVTGDECDPAGLNASGGDVPEDRTTELLAVIEQYPPAQKKKAEQGAAAPLAPVMGDDAEQLDKARRSKQGPKFAALYDRGDTSSYGGDDSAADLALCNMLVFWLGKDAERVERAFTASALGQRAKWKERSDYRERTVGCAIDGATEVYDPEHRSAPVEIRPVQQSAAEDDADSAEPPDGQTRPAWWQPPQDAETWNDPHRLARLFVDANRTPAGLPAIVQWRDEFFIWNGSAYRPLGDGDLDAQLTRHARSVFVADLPGRRAEAALSEVVKPVKLFPVTGRVRSDSRVNLSALANVPDDGRDAPFWLRCALDFDPREVVTAPNGLFTLEQIARGEHPFALQTPNLFTLNALPFAVPFGECDPPRVWLEKVSEWFNGDSCSILGLQEWLGYLLSADASQHKILMLVGPPRSGKGTVLRTIVQLVGAASVAATSFAAMGESFGLQDLIGKRVAMIPDARLSGRTDTAQVVERLLSVSGDDLQTVNRKNLPRVSTRLTARFVLGTNEIPKLADASGALASRFHILDFPNTYLDREDKHLGTKLGAELPAILQWAAKGYVRLRTQGAFTQSEAAAKHHRHLEELSSPIRAFVRERCNVGPTERIAISELYAAWCDFCESRAIMPGSDSWFGRDLRSACPQVTDVKVRSQDGRTKCLKGINLRARDDWGDRSNLNSAAAAA